MLASGMGLSLSSMTNVALKYSSGPLDRAVKFGNYILYRAGQIASYVGALDERWLVKTKCLADNTIVGVSISIDGYCHLDTLKSWSDSGARK